MWGDRRAAETVRDLAYIGIDNIAGYFDVSVLDSYEAENGRLQSYEQRSAGELADMILSHEATLLDIRAEDEWQSGRIPGVTISCSAICRNMGRIYQR